jgi:hypothetical protein
VDIKRAPPKKTKRNIMIAGGVVAATALTVALSQLEARPPSVPQGELMIDSVVRGPLVINVRAPGTLVPEHIRYVVAVTSGRVEAKPLQPGATVERNTVLLEMSNPDVELEYLNAQSAVTDAERQLVDLKTNLQSGQLAQESQIATIKTNRAEALRQVELFQALDKKNLSSANEVKRAKDLAEELEARLVLEQRRLDVMVTSAKDQVRLAEENLQRLREIERFQATRRASMRVMAGDEGVLQSLATTVELGQWVLAGQVLATVAQPGRLKAVLRVPETQANVIAVGQKAVIDTRNGMVPGRVIRADPSSQNGTVAVEVALEGSLPSGARADISVDGTIEITRLDNVLHVGRPAYGQPESTVGLFKLDPSGDEAQRVSVKLGRASVNTIEVVNGLQPGDRVIVSDMSRFDNANKVRIN